MEELLHNGAKVAARSALREDTSGRPRGPRAGDPGGSDTSGGQGPKSGRFNLVSGWWFPCLISMPNSLWYIYTGWWFGTMEFYDFPYIGNNNPNWLSYFSERLKPPTSICVMLNTFKSADKSEILFACQGTGNVREGTGAWCSTEWSAGYVVHVMLLVCLICLHVYMYVDFQNILTSPNDTAMMCNYLLV